MGQLRIPTEGRAHKDRPQTSQADSFRRKERSAGMKKMPSGKEFHPPRNGAPPAGLMRPHHPVLFTLSV